MDQPTLSSDAPDRAASSEPGPTRLNPFDEGPLSSRKRRRTSHSGSPSLSAESPASDQHMTSSGTIDQGDHLGQVDHAHAMQVDTASAEPRTPERQSSGAGPLSEPPSSRVTTINLRNQPHSDISSSSPVSPHPGHDIQQLDDLHGQLDGSADDAEIASNRIPLPAEADNTSTSSAASTASLDAETGIGDFANPIFSFPFHDHAEPLPAAVSRLVQYFQTASSGEESVLSQLCRWVELCINFFRRISAQETLGYFQSQPAFWYALPELFFSIALKRSLYPRNSVLRATASLVINGFAHFTGLITAVDLEFLTSCRAMMPQLDEHEPPCPISASLVSGVNRIARRDQMRRHNSQVADVEAQRDLFDERAMLLRALQASTGGRIGCLLKLAQTEVALIKKFPQMIEHLGPVSQLAALLISEAARALRNPANPNINEFRSYLTIGFQFYQIVADALSYIIEKHVTQLNPDSASVLLNSLTEILKTSLGGEHRQAKDRLDLHAQNHPGLPAHYTADAIACEWRLDIMASLIRCSQMQLRVMAVTQMGSELVQLWKQHSEDLIPNELLTHVAQYILHTELVDYTLGSSCHPEITGESGNIVGFLAKAIELIWHMMLRVADSDLVDLMISILVKDVYIGSKAILAYPHHRARAVHTRMVNRCLGQLDGAARAIEARDSTEDAPHEANDDEHAQAQERIFIRSLALLREFLKAHQSNPQFAAPDLRSLMSQVPCTVKGELTDLQYESYDGGGKSDMSPLEIGADNTVATLLARLREVTGFDNYRVYHHGKIFAPDEDEISRSLKDIGMTTGLLLVKREVGGVAPATRANPGASFLEIEILSHFGQLWNYLDLQEPLASEIFHFLVNLPVDAKILKAIDSTATTHRDIFPKGQCHKSIYAVYALKEYLKSARRKQAAAVSSGRDDDRGEDVLAKALTRSQALVVAALSDREALDDCSSSHKLFLCQELIGLYLHILQDSYLMLPLATSMTTAPVACLVDILVFAVDSSRNEATVDLITKTFASILLSSTTDVEFWISLQQYHGIAALIERLVLQEPSPYVRMEIVKAINTRSTDFERAAVTSTTFCEFLWPVLNSLVPRAMDLPQSCNEFFILTQLILKKLLALQSTVVRANELVHDCIIALTGHETSEQLGKPFIEDRLASGLLRLLRCCLKDEQILESCSFAPGLINELFWRHLFPPPRRRTTQPTPRSLLSPSSREMLCETLLDIAKGNQQHRTDLLRQLGKLVIFDTRPGAEPYQYELPMNFDRDQAVRAECGYAGLRNLSNTCYLNSLFTQLFMNTNFRRFMMEAPTGGSNQELLEETQITFAHMQETSQQYVDTSQMVSWIKTYDDTMIDIHNQMDVDEFYNLLFDRWESQMASAGKRNAFRAFYGGQLVQQVRSKECDHISERLEPFSAIQCDIKGKTTLLDSLRDYVDGEIMEGENKYKCSTCDRHVDAVKRACLKDIPNDLIFHLKRFDFNLRTLTRSKINDYFSFPNRIDMRPYTVDYLNQESPTSEEDVFELVGVLVHSGTAESGHYYSYIRERPSTADQETWLEFNDEAVSTWDAAQLEAATFGGPDTNQVNDANSVAYDKSYSAYMLFYQRSSVLRASRQEMQAQGLVPPLHVDIIPDLHEVIKNNNTVFLRRHCLFDRNHAVFALQFFEFMMSFNNGQCSLEHQAERSAMAMLLGHLDQVVGRSKTSVLFHRYKTSLQTRFRNCHKCAEAFLDYFVGRPEAFRQLVQRNPEPSYRLATGDMLIIALEEIREHDPAYYGPEAPPADDEILVPNSAIDGALILFRKIFENFHCNLRSWNECFHLILRFAELGDAETAALLHDDWLKDLMFVIAADANYPGLPEHYVMLVRGLSRRMSNKPPSYDVIIQLINHLMKALEPLVQDDMVEEANERLALYLEDPSQPLPWTSEEVNVLFAEDRDYGGSFFIRRLLEIDQEQQDTCAIICRLAKGDEHMQKCVTRVLGNMISGKAEMHSMVPFLWAALTFVTHCNDPDTSQQVLQHVTQACRVLENNEGKSFLDFFQRAIQALVCMPLAEAKPGLMMHLELVPLWGPGLIGCVDKRSASLAQQWIEGFLVRYETQWAHEDAELHDRLVQAARQLGVGCLQYLQEQYVLAERQVVGSTIEPLHKMIVASEAYFEIDIDGGVSREGFHHLKEGILESVERLLIEELDEDGSDWEDSSSDQMKSMADVQLRALSG
ncbi:hypothetical protein VDGE_06482 [Verticillium dahliae]|uniref:USP domain-containing protein n=1 Tax=Verticillium dahliae TaxID=27337 RepID=A0A444S295_VERDA|nr:hypothetical protein VDGE_06482 [Verticillium dahliae]